MTAPPSWYVLYARLAPPETRARFAGGDAGGYRRGVDAERERLVAQLWASLDERSDEEFLAAIDELAAQLPPAIAAFERASAYDSTGHPDRAVPLYREALAAGLQGIRRRRAVIQLASSLRNLGDVEESVALLTAERSAGSDELDDAVSAFLALALVSAGREREAVSLVLAALAPHLPRYQRSVTNYAQDIG
jgi:tetratricopeptide (TPR) repeat protein